MDCASSAELRASQFDVQKRIELWDSQPSSLVTSCVPSACQLGPRALDGFDVNDIDVGLVAAVLIHLDCHAEFVSLVPQPQAEDVKRITRPEAVLTIDDIDGQQVTIVLGKGTAQEMKARR